MSQRPDTTKWFCYILALSAAPLWTPVRSVAAKAPPSNPTTVQAQAKFFQYRHLPTSEDFDQGHRLGSDRHFTERHERSRPSAGLFSAKVRWGDKKGGYGEHYWDLNHAGSPGNNHDDGYHNSDDGTYNVRDHPSDSYDEPNDHSLYGNDDYDPDKSSGSYEENGRSKRAYSKVKAEKKPQNLEYDDDDDDEEEEDHRQHRKQTRKHADPEPAPSHKVKADSDEEDTDFEIYKKATRKHQQQRQKEVQQPKEQKNQVVLVVKEKDDSPTDQSQYNQNHHPDKIAKYVNYENGAGVRQHQQPEVAASAPRLFLDHTTGRVVDRATGQAYILQPILTNNY